MSTNRRVLVARVVAGMALVEGCSIYQGAYGAPVDAAEEARLKEGRRKGGILGGTSAPSGDVEVVEPLADETVGWGMTVRRRDAGLSSSSSTGKSNGACVNCSAAPFILKTVENLYLKGYADGVAALAPHVEFEDPAVRHQCVVVCETNIISTVRWEPDVVVVVDVDDDDDDERRPADDCE